jgi:1-deoxy-D-xylulose-5-phosphate reductoisomerase
VVSALVGTAGLIPTLDAIKAGKAIALANKELLVMAGEHVMRAAQQHQTAILPVDSEHSALFQCLQGNSASAVKQLWLTASGGAFRTYDRARLERVTPEDALKHPNWTMGSKVTIDSATLANKGLEMIEARWLFQMQPKQIQVVVHPESIVHSMVEYVDGSFIAQLCPPSMIFPVQYALLYPERQPTSRPTLDFRKVMQLNFGPPDETRFPCLRYARNAMLAGGWTPAVFNAANEIAVNAFVQKKISFLEIPEIIDYTMQQCPTEDSPSLEAILQADTQARELATERVKSLQPSHSF